MDNRENGYSKEEFQESLERSITHRWNNNSGRLTKISQVKSFVWIFMITGIFMGGILPTLFLYSSQPFSALTNSDNATVFGMMKAFGLGGIIFFLAGFMDYKKIGVYRKLEEFFNLKEMIISEKENLQIFIENDVATTGVNIYIIGNIKRFVSSILEGYKLISKSHQYIQSHMWYFGKIPQEGQDIINTELQWIVDYSKEFTILIQSWISHHTTELAELEKQIESQELSTENSGGKATLGLQRLSLQEHLKELEKVRV